MSDPKFDTWDELEAWREREESRGVKLIEDCRDQCEALATTIRRVVAAHSHLED